MGRARDLAGLEFQSQTASVSAANATTVTLFTLPANNFATYIVTAGVIANDPSNYHEVAIISQQGNTLLMTTLVNAALANISISGLDIRASQSSGIATTIHGRLTCLTRE